MIRVLRVIETGQWCGPAVINGRMPDDPGYADRVAAVLGLRPGSLEVIDAEDDPRTGKPESWLNDPNVTPPPPEPKETLEERIARLEAIVKPPEQVR